MIKKRKVKKRDYHYIKRGRLYVCVQQNILLLAWFLLVKNKSLGLPTLGVSWGKGFSLIKSLIRYRLSLNSGAIVCVLPLQGNLALDVHQGHKIFLFNQLNVAKVMAPDISTSSMMREIESVQTAGRLDIAPVISQYNIENRWYIEDYIPGQFLYNSQKIPSECLYKMYETEIIKCLATMILSQPSHTVSLIEYVQNLVSRILEEKLSSIKLDQQRQTIIQEFIKSIETLLCNTSTQKINLIFSHGDFSLQNILKTRNTIKVIDWEGAKSRSILYDFYNFFMTEIYYERPKGDLVTEIQTAQSKLQSRLMKKGALAIINVVLSEPLFHRLFFLERVLMLLERDLSERSLNVLMRSIEIFRGYEKLVVIHNDE